MEVKLEHSPPNTEFFHASKFGLHPHFGYRFKKKEKKNYLLLVPLSDI